MKATILLDEVSKHFGEGHATVQALAGVSFEVPEGALVVIAGPSGSGKSTLLGVIGGLERPDSGRVHVAGREIADLDERRLSRLRRAHLGFVFQEFNLISDLTARENIEFPLRLNRVAARERSRRVEALIERLGLERRARAFPIELSAGERQRVAIARAVAHRPSVLLADEPTANLDSANAGEAIQLLAQLQKEENIPVLVATHDPRIIDSIESRIFLRDGAVERIENLSM